MPLEDEVCPMFGNHCRHLSVEKTSRPYTEIERDGRTGLYVPKGCGRKVVVVGEYCNDSGKYVRDMHYCPVKYSMTRSTQQPLKELVDLKKRREEAMIKKLMMGCVGWR
jgi:hypothetical protein